MLLLLALVVLAALGFTVGAFWWVHLRPGRLTAVAPTTYAVPAGSVLHLRFPFVFVNDGAVPEVVADLRLRLVDGTVGAGAVAGDRAGQDGTGGGHVFHWTSTRCKVTPAMDDFVDSAAPFVVTGRDAVRRVAEFGQVPPEWRPEAGRAYPLALDALGRTGEWRTLVEFIWFAPARLEPVGAGVAHRNTEGGTPLI